MKGFFDRLRWRLSLWLEGRYGADSLSNVLNMVGLALLLIAVLTGFTLLWAFAMGVILLSAFRTFSKNIPQRERENEAWLSLIAKPKETISLARKAWANRATTKYFRCKGCGAVLSVPKGKGKLRVTCPKCHWQTEKKS